MTQITARVPEELAEALDAAAAVLKRSRADVVRQALERYLEDFDDLSVAGIDPPHRGEGLPTIRFPRPRGDRPRIRHLSSYLPSVPPPTRG